MKNLLLCFIMLLTACAHRIDFSDNAKFNEKDGLESNLKWMKVKPSKVDFMVYLENHYKHPILIERNAFSMEVEGIKSAGAIETNWQEIMNMGDVISPIIVLRFNESRPTYGKGKITIRHIYSYKDDKKGEKLPDLVHEFEVNSIR